MTVLFWLAQGLRLKACARRRAFTGSDAMSAASLAAAAEGDHVALLASGAWTVERAAELERLIEDASRQHAGARSIDIDLAGLERLDTFGAWLIERLKRSFLRRGSAARITGLSETDRALMAELRAVNQIAFKKWRRPTRSSSRSMPSAATSPRSAALSCWSCSFSAHWCWRRSARSRIRALYGAGLVCWLYGGMAPPIFIERLREAIWLPTFEVGMIKAPFMALTIGLVACTEGFEVDGSAASLGLKTTASVVKSIFLVIALDGLFALFFAGIGM